MELALNLDQMTVADKLAAMERLWEDLSRTPEAVPSPSWHGEVLSAREKQISEGKASVTTFSIPSSQTLNLCTLPAKRGGIILTSHWFKKQ